MEINMSKAKMADVAKGMEAIMMIRAVIQEAKEIQEGLVYGILHDRLECPVRSSEKLVDVLIKDGVIQRRVNLLVWKNA